MAHIAPLREALDPAEGIERSVRHPFPASRQVRLQHCADISDSDNIHAVQCMITLRDKHFTSFVLQFTAAQALGRRVKTAARVEEIFKCAEIVARHRTGFYPLNPHVRIETSLLRRIEHTSVLHTLLRQDVSTSAFGRSIPEHGRNQNRKQHADDRLHLLVPKRPLPQCIDCV